MNPEGDHVTYRWCRRISTLSTAMPNTVAPAGMTRPVFEASRDMMSWGICFLWRKKYIDAHFSSLPLYSIWPIIHDKGAICLCSMTHNKYCILPHSSTDYMFECQITCGGRSRWCQAWMRLSMMPSPNNPASTVSVTTKETLPAGQNPNHISKNIEKHTSKGAMGIIWLTFYSRQIFLYFS